MLLILDNEGVYIVDGQHDKIMIHFPIRGMLLWSEITEWTTILFEFTV